MCIRDSPATDLGATLKDKIKTSITSADMVMEAYHDLIQSITTARQLSPDIPSQWAKVMLKAFSHEIPKPEDKLLMNMALEMAAIPPSNLPGWFQDAVSPI